MPHLALPSLTAYLRAKGIQVIQRDLNAELFDWVLSEQHLRATLNHLRRRARLARRQPGIDRPDASARLTEWALERGRSLAAGIEGAKSVLRSERFYDPPASRAAFLSVVDALVVASAPYGPSELTLTRYSSLYPPDASQAIVAATRDRRYNMYRSILQTRLIPDIRKERPDLIGISLTSADQVIAGFTIAALLRSSEKPASLPTSCSAAR